MAEELADDKKPSVGERYRSIRLSITGNQELEACLMSEALHGNDIRKYWSLVSILESLLPFKCLWPDMRLSTLHKIFAMRCDDLIVNYLQHIRAIWRYILDDDSHPIENMDYASVQILELTCPSMSESDAEMIRKSPICGSLSEQQ